MSGNSRDRLDTLGYRELNQAVEALGEKQGMGIVLETTNKLQGQMFLCWLHTVTTLLEQGCIQAVMKQRG